MKPDPLAYFKPGKTHNDCQCQHCKLKGEDKRKRRRELRASTKEGLRREENFEQRNREEAWVMAQLPQEDEGRD